MHTIARALPCLLTLAAWSWTGAARAGETTPILPLAEVKPGMVGEARTVFAGTEPETFKVRVVSVLRNFLPRQDVILIRAEDARVEALGIAAGMSGSPVYVDGKLMGAIAYGWSFAKEPLAGVTPIESMLAEGDRPDRPPPDPGLGAGPMAVAPAPGGDGSVTQLRPVTIPLSVSGASDASLSYLREELQASGLHPVRAGGGGGRLAPGPPRALVPGAAVGVALVSGDMTTTAMGTLTYSDGKRIFAFGHPMFGIGSVSLPLVQGEIHAIIPSLSSSLKMASPIAEIGTVTDDLRTGIIGELGLHPGTVPLQVRVTSRGVAKRPFTVAIARHRRLLPVLATLALSTALAQAVPDVTDLTAEVTTRLFLRGFGPVELRDYLFSNQNLAPRVLAMSHGIRALAQLSGNVFAPAVVERIEVGVSVEYRADTAAIVGLAAPGEQVRAGHRMPLRVTLRPYGGPEFVEIVEVAVPRSLAGRIVKVEVAGGALVKPELPRAETLPDLIANLRTYYPAASLVVSLTTADDGVALRGRLLRNLPPSALDTLRSASESRRGDIYRVVKRTAFPRTRVLSGKSEIEIRVREPGTH